MEGLLSDGFVLHEAELLEGLRKVEVTCDDYQQLGLLVHELAYNAVKIYKKGTTEQKRLLFSQIITNFKQNRCELKPNFNLAGIYLYEWMPRLNQDYELKKALQTMDEVSFFEKTDCLAPNLGRCSKRNKARKMIQSPYD